MVGVFSRQWIEPVAEVLKTLGSERVWVVHGSDGLDEITTTGPTYVAEMNGGKIRTFDIKPTDVGLKTAKPEDLKGADGAHNAQALRAVLEGKPGAYRDVAILNAAASLVVAGKANALAEGVKLAAQSVDSGAAKARLEKLVQVSNAKGM
jgi:anthranilate phosphoribosyltransferase